KEKVLIRNWCVKFRLICKYQSKDFDSLILLTYYLLTLLIAYSLISLIRYLLSSRLGIGLFL
ncbi:hypothetical protein, partial [Campylobacter coli]|uniref:hypothetical protein n=1 Tax=Campylobacter coli TaxID=195 RepID=UPI000AFEDD58